jgi:hypothetical protein
VQTDSLFWRQFGLTANAPSQGDYFQRFVVKRDNPMTESRIDAWAMLSVTFILFLDFGNQWRVLNSEKGVWFQSELIEWMTLQCLVIGVTEPVVKNTLKFQESDGANGSNRRVYEVSADQVTTI